MFKKVLAAGAIVIASLAAPLAANAADAPYGAPVNNGDTVTTGAGEPIAIAVNVPGFINGVDATVTVDGPGSATITPIVTSVGIAHVASGVATFSVTPSVVGVYHATVAQGVQSVSVTITATSGLPSTGVNDPTPTIWIAGGLVAVGIALIVTFVAVRRQNAKGQAEV